MLPWRTCCTQTRKLPDQCSAPKVLQWYYLGLFALCLNVFACIQDCMVTFSLQISHLKNCFQPCTLAYIYSFSIDKVVTFEEFGFMKVHLHISTKNYSPPLLSMEQNNSSCWTFSYLFLMTSHCIQHHCRDCCERHAKLPEHLPDHARMNTGLKNSLSHF